jgi:hypothetical protein
VTPAAVGWRPHTGGTVAVLVRLRDGQPEVLGRSAADLERSLAGLRQALGPPRQKDHRLASLVAWLALGLAAP